MFQLEHISRMFQLEHLSECSNRNIEPFSNCPHPIPKVTPVTQERKVDPSSVRSPSR
jgi:hypothetical protein